MLDYFSLLNVFYWFLKNQFFVYNMQFILGQKLDMTQIWDNNRVIACTRVQAGPCVVTDIKNKKRDGYVAVQISFGERKEKNIKKPQKVYLKKINVSPRYLREFRVEDAPKDLKVGDIINIDTFKNGDMVKVQGVSKGRGFQGVVKRHGFAGSKKTHGNKDQLRMPGSIGATGPAHVFKGQRMPGRMGNDQVSVANLEIVKVDLENNILFVKGAIPGARNGLVLISGAGELKVGEILKKAESVDSSTEKEITENAELNESSEKENTEEKNITKGTKNTENTKENNIDEKKENVKKDEKKEDGEDKKEEKQDKKED